jgi:undecaprenyl-phosphate 4-deoxy-4-formamido-L-arabinose transferase
MGIQEHTLPPGVSVVIPVYNGEGTLPDLVTQLADVLPGCSERFEVILVNDASPDNSWEVIRRLTERYGWVQGINLTRNAGQHNATLCGVRSAHYAVTVTMDDDLQHPPSEIPKLLAKLAEGYALVYGTPQHRPHSWYRTALSRVVKHAVAAASRQPSLVSTFPFRAFRTTLRAASVEYRSPRLILDVLLGWATTEITAIPVQYASRREGISNYSAAKLVEMTVFLWTTYTTVPLRLASVIGFFFVVFGMIVLAYVGVTYWLDGSIPGFPFLAGLISIFGGVQLFTLGMVGEYLANVFERSLNRPLYLIGDVTGQGEMKNAGRATAKRRGAELGLRRQIGEHHGYRERATKTVRGVVPPAR